MDPDLRVRPFFLHGETISIREFVVGAFNAEMGLDAVDPDTSRRQQGPTRGYAIRHGSRWHDRQDRGAADRRSGCRSRW